MLEKPKKSRFFSLAAFAIAFLATALSPFAAADSACTISDVSVSTPSSSTTTGTNIVFTTTATANDTCTASTIQLVSTGQSTGASLTISDPGSPYYYSNTQVSTSGTTKTFTATAGVADTYNYYVQTTFQTSPGSKSSSTGILRVISPSTLTTSGTPTSTQNKTSGQSFTYSVTINNPTSSAVTTSYNLSYDASSFTVTGDATSSTGITISAGSSTNLQWTITYSANLSSSKTITFQLGDNSNAFSATATSPATPTPTPAPASSGSSSSTTTTTTTTTPPISIPTKKPTTTPAPTIQPTPAPTQLGSNTQLSSNIGTDSSTFNLSYTAGSQGFNGILSNKLPFEYADYLKGRITFDPEPLRVYSGSVIAEWQANLKPQEKFTAKITIDKTLDENILDLFTAFTATEQATPAPTSAPLTQNTPVPSLEAQPAATADTQKASDGVDPTFILAALALIVIAAGAFMYYRKNKQGL